MNDTLTAPEETAISVEPYAEARRLVEREYIGTEGWRKLDAVDAALEATPGTFRELPTNHLFCGKLYLRQVFMEKGILLTTRVHLTEHPYLISLGVVSVWEPAVGWTTVQGYYQGITKPGTRRLLLIHEDCIWTTVHENPNGETDPDKIIDAITFDHRKLRHYEGAPT